VARSLAHPHQPCRAVPGMPAAPPAALSEWYEGAITLKHAGCHVCVHEHPHLPWHAPTESKPNGCNGNSLEVPVTRTGAMMGHKVKLEALETSDSETITRNMPV